MFVADQIQEAIEDCIAVICRVLNYNPGECWQMGYLEFWRTVARAHKHAKSLDHGADGAKGKH